MTEIAPATPDAIARAVALLEKGGIVALPTETVYGLAADATDGEAVARVYAAKDRPSFNPLIAHVTDIGMAERHVRMPSLAGRLAAKFWPGPLTLVLPRLRESPVAGIVTAGLPTLALRAPAHPVMQAALRAFGAPLAAPSANPSGRLSPTRAAHVAAGLTGRVPLILDGGPAKLGLESTVVAVDTDRLRLLRAGPVTAEMLAEFGKVEIAPAGPVEAPGMTESHYAPTHPLRLNAACAREDEVHIGFGDVGGHFSLSPGGSLVEAAAKLFDALHEADARARRGIAVAPIPEDGLGAAINDRLRRAAASL